MHRHMQGDTLQRCQQFGIYGKMYVEVIRASSSMAKYENGLVSIGLRVCD